VGSALVKQIVAARGSCAVWLLTPKYQASFYEHLDFQVVPPWQVPRCASKLRSSSSPGWNHAIP
jgi:hypothetical protein